MILLINGWAADPSIWETVQPSEACLYYDVNQSSKQSDLLTNIKQNCPPQEKLTVIGWSMGGLLALELAASCPEKIRDLILISSTACFVQKENYTAGLPRAIVRQLKRRIKRDTLNARRDFFQQMFTPAEKEVCTKFLQQEPALQETSSLLSGLDYLETCDLRPLLPKLQLPVQILHGSDDAICPVTAGRYLAQHLPQAKLLELPGCGHVPFLAQKEYCQEHIFRRIFHD